MSEFSVEEFRRMADELQARAGYKKQDIAKSISLSVGYFSKIYNADKPLTHPVFLKLRDLWEAKKDQHQGTAQRGQDRQPEGYSMDDIKERLTRIEKTLDLVLLHLGNRKPERRRINRKGAA